MGESLRKIPYKKWPELQIILRSDLPRCLCTYNFLEVQKKWIQQGFDYDFRIYSPFGNMWNGVVVVLKQETFWEIYIDCPRDETTYLEEALRRTRRIDWQQKIVIMFTSSHITNCILRIAEHINVEVRVNKLHMYMISEESPPFEVSLPPELCFKLLSPEHVDFIDSVWPHRYEGSDRYFQILVENKFGYGLFSGEELVAWAFIKEIGALGHIFTVEKYRSMGYGILVVKLVCNVLKKENLDVFSFAIKENDRACKLHEKIGFEKISVVGTCHLKFKEDVENTEEPFPMKEDKATFVRSIPLDAEH